MKKKYYLCNTEKQDDISFASVRLKKLTNMRYAFLTIGLFGLTNLAASAQDENKNKISVSYGVGAMPEFRDFAITLGSLTDVQYTEQTGTFSVQYLRFLNKRFGVGGTLAYERLGGKGNMLFNKETSKKFSEHNIALMPTVSAYWYRNRIVGIYSQAAIGTCIICRQGLDKAEAEKNELELAFQLSAAGIDVGNEHIRFFTEVGFGYQGIVNLGLSYAF